MTNIHRLLKLDRWLRSAWAKEAESWAGSLSSQFDRLIAPGCCANASRSG